MKSKIEFFYDCSSPWTYLAFSEIENLVARQDLKLIWKPILVGGVFNSSNPSVYASRENPVKAKQKYSTKDLQDWSKIRGLTINWPDVFPVNSVKAMRGAFYAINKEMISEYSSRVFFSYWTEGNDISQDEVLIEIISSLDFDSQDFFSFIELDQTKELLKSNTQELIDRGGFGSPTIFIDENNMFFGNDRLKLIEEILQGPS
ncbi:MAG: 2-hydroxychromene-2-carboxylate isomerase [Gammaproteobacteria bacterium]|nr:2-hydroxychromene-2-carboxylate isomerase [Gammaproteobacteria bacterium]|tara:strand:+ start:95 stop:703 length:609 start_codon:yes stop_codon:yes gene_type:complete